MEKKLQFWLCFALLSFSLNHLFANNTIPTNHISMEDVSACELPLPDSFRIAGLGSGYVSLAWNPNNPGDDYLLTIFQENNTGNFDSVSAILVYDVDAYTINNLTSPRAFKFRIQPVCPNGKVNVNVSAYTPPVNLILELTTNGISPNIYQYVPCENIPIPQKPNDWIGFQLTDLSTNSSATFQFEVINSSPFAGKVHRVTQPEENQILVSADKNEIWPTEDNNVLNYALDFKVGKTNGPESLEFYERLTVNIHENYIDICEFENWTRPGFYFHTMKGTVGGNQGKIKSNTEQINIKVQNPINRSINIFIEDSMHNEETLHIELRTISGRIIQTYKINNISNYLNFDMETKIPNGIYFLTIKYNVKLQTFKVIVVND